MGLKDYIRECRLACKSALKLRRAKQGKRMLFVCRPATVYGGGQQYLYRLLEAMKIENLNVVFASPIFKNSNQFSEEVELRGASCLVFPRFSTRYKELVFWLAIACAFGPSFVHINGYHAGTFAILVTAPILKVFLRAKICLTQHLSLFSEGELSVISRIRGVRRRILSLEHYRWPMRDYYEKRWLLKMADRVIFVDGNHAKLYQSMLKLKRTKVKTIINGVDTEKFMPGIVSEPERTQLRTSFGVPQDVILIIGVGNLIPQKRFDIFIQTVAALFHRGYSVKGLIVGTGPLRDALEKLACQKGCTELIIFAGYRPDIPKLLNISDLFLMTSDDEGLPYALLEARACGLPAIATAVGGIDQVIRDGLDGYIVAPGSKSEILDSAEKLLANPSARISMGKKARENTVGEFSLLEMQFRTMEVFGTLEINPVR